LTDFVTAAIQLFPLWLLLDLAPSVIAGAVVAKILKMPMHQIRRPAFFEPGDVTWLTLVGPFFEELFFRGLPMLILGGYPGLVVGSIVWIAAHIPSRYSLIEAYPRVKKAAYLFTYVTVLLLSSAFYIVAWTLNGAVAILYHIAHNTIAVLTGKRYEREREKRLEQGAAPSGGGGEEGLGFVKPRALEGGEEASAVFVKPKKSVFASELEDVEHVFVKRKKASEAQSE